MARYSDKILELERLVPINNLWSFCWVDKKWSDLVEDLVTKQHLRGLYVYRVAQ